MRTKEEEQKREGEREQKRKSKRESKGFLIIAPVALTIAQQSVDEIPRACVL